MDPRFPDYRKQRAFEKCLDDLDKLLTLKYKQAVGDVDNLDQTILDKAASLAKHYVHVSEASTYNDIDRLFNLRSRLLNPYSYRPASDTGRQIDANESMRATHRPVHAFHAVCVDDILAQKISGLESCDMERIDLDPFDAILKLSELRETINNMKIEGNTPIAIYAKFSFAVHLLQHKERFLLRLLSGDEDRRVESSQSNPTVRDHQVCL